MLLLIAVVLVLALALAGLWLWLRTSQDVADEVERFAKARATTSKWASDPSSAPAPVLDIAARGGQPVGEEGKGATRGR